MVDAEANPDAFGLGGFALPLFIFSLVNAEIMPIESFGVLIPIGFFYGGLTQFLAGMWDIKKGELFGATFFISYGSFWMGFTAMFFLQTRNMLPETPPIGMAFFYIAWGIFSAYLSVASGKIFKGILIVNITVTLLFFLLAAGEFYPLIRIIAGYEGIICALSAWYTSAGILINSIYNKGVIPLGASK